MGKTPIDRLKGLSADTIRAQGSVIYNRLDLSDRTLSVFALLIAGVALVFAITARDAARISERESRLAQEDLVLLRGAIVANGIPIDLHQLRKEAKERKK